MNEAYVIQTIREYEEEYLATPDSNCTKDIFKQLSYSHWAVDEILERIVEEASKLPPHITGISLVPHTEIIQEFIDEMDYLAETSETENSKTMFSTAKSTGIEVLNLFL